MAMCYQKHPFEIESQDRLTTINTKIFEIKKKIQLSEGQRKSHYEESETEKQQNNELIDTLKKETKVRLQELARARAGVAEDRQLTKYLSEVSPVGNKNIDQIIHNLDLKVIDQRKALDLMKYDRRAKKSRLKTLEKEYEHLLIENTRSVTEKVKSTNPAEKHAAHLENEIHKVLVQWNEAELVKKKYGSIRKALVEDSVKFESSLSHMSDLLKKQREEIAKLERVRAEATEMRLRATAALVATSARALDAEQTRLAERAYYTQRFEERKRELDKLEKRIFPPASRAAVARQDSSASEGVAVTEENTAAKAMEDIFQRLMKLTGVTEAEEVFDRFRAQRETCKRLNYLQQTTEQEKLDLEEKQTVLIAELEAFKFASVKDKDEAQDKIAEMKAQIQQEIQHQCELEKTGSELDALLMEMKRLLYDLCKLLDVISEPDIPEWTAEARDIQELLHVLTTRYETATARADEIRQRRGDVTPVMPSNPPSGATSAGVSAHTTPREPEAAVPTYKELLQKEPNKLPPSDEEEDIPSRSYLKRQAQLILDTKSRRKGFRPPYPRK